MVLLIDMHNINKIIFLLKSYFLTKNDILVTNSKIKTIRYSKIKSIIVYPILV